MIVDLAVISEGLIMSSNGHPSAETTTNNNLNKYSKYETLTFKHSVLSVLPLSPENSTFSNFKISTVAATMSSTIFNRCMYVLNRMNTRSKLNDQRTGITPGGKKVWTLSRFNSYVSLKYFNIEV